MIPLARETVTLYNRRLVAGADGRAREVWRRRVLRGCSWVRAHERVRDEGIVRYAESVACRIPASADYLPPGDWDAQGAPPGEQHPRKGGGPGALHFGFAGFSAAGRPRPALPMGFSLSLRSRSVKAESSALLRPFPAP